VSFAGQSIHQQRGDVPMKFKAMLPEGIPLTALKHLPSENELLEAVQNPHHDFWTRYLAALTALEWYGLGEQEPVLTYVIPPMPELWE
jgi:hypothetical protein